MCVSELGCLLDLDIFLTFITHVLRDYTDLCQATTQTTHLELEQADINRLADGNQGGFCWAPW